MGFLDFFDYNRPGKGVSKDEPEKIRLIVFFEVYFRKFSRLIQLNLIYFLFSIPSFIVLFFLAAFVLKGPIEIMSAQIADEGQRGITIMYFLFAAVLFYSALMGTGPATAGLVYVLRNFAGETHAWVWSDFKEFSLKNFWRGILVFSLDCVFMLLMFINMSFYGSLPNQGFLVGAIKSFIWLAGLIYAMMHYYIYTMMVSFDLKLGKIFKNAFLLTMAKLPQNFLMFLLACALALGFVLSLYAYAGIILIPCLMFSTVVLALEFYIYPVIKKYAAEKPGEGPGEDSIFKD